MGLEIASHLRHMWSQLEEDNLLEAGQDLLQLLLVVEERVVEGHARRHAVHLHTKVLQIVVGDVRATCGHLCREENNMHKAKWHQ